jgi:CysZ protein
MPARAGHRERCSAGGVGASEWRCKVLGVMTWWGMVTALRKTLRDLFDPRLTVTLVKAVLLSVVGYAAVWAMSWWLLGHSRWAESVWLDRSLHLLGGLAGVVLSLLLFPAVFGVLQSLFLDGVADRIEGRHYPELGPPRGTAIRDGLMVAVKVMVLMIVVNLLMLPVYIVGSLLLGAGMMLFYAVNGWLCGREYYAQVALRRMPRGEVRQWTRANRWTLWMAGVGITLLGTIPVLNLAAPVIGCAFMVHVARGLRAPR